MHFPEVALIVIKLLIFISENHHLTLGLAALPLLLLLWNTFLRSLPHIQIYFGGLSTIHVSTHLFFTILRGFSTQQAVREEFGLCFNGNFTLFEIFNLNLLTSFHVNVA